MALNLEFPASLGKLNLSFSLVRNAVPGHQLDRHSWSFVASFFSVSLCLSLANELSPENENPARRLGLTADFSELSRRDRRFPCQKAA